MRWNGQQVLDDGVGAAAALPGLRGLLRSVRTPEFAGIVFHEVEAKSALNRVPGTSPVPFRWTVNPYRGCSHACVYCLAGHTRVLLADGRTRPIAQLQVGDAVIGTRRVDGGRRYVRTTVLAHWATEKPAHRVRLTGGTELITSGEHRFLGTRGWRHVAPGWCRSGRRPHLRAGSTLLGPGSLPGEPAGGQRSPGYRQGYLCGVVHGDGPSGPAGFPSDRLELEALGRAHHFLADVARLPVPSVAGAARAGTPEPGRVAAPHRNGVPARIAEVVRWPQHPGPEWCAGFLAGLVDACGTAEHGVLRIAPSERELVQPAAGALRRLGLQACVHGAAGERELRVHGASAMLRFLRAVDPAVGSRRVLDGAAVEAAPGLEVESVERLGGSAPVVVPMYDITTGTGDFVAEGVISHNCFARNSHTYLDLDAGADFDSEIVVKVNVARVLDRELSAPRWNREPVAMGTNTDPYQRAEGRYRLMPGVISALARSGTPFSVLTKGTMLARDLPQLAGAAADVPVSLGVSIALLDRSLQGGLEPGTPSPAARLELVRRITDAGLDCGVVVAPVLPLLTDSAEALDALLAQIRAAGASGATVLALHLRPGTREWFSAWLGREHPRLVEPYERLYRRGAYADPEYRRALGERVAPLLRRHDLDRGTGVPRAPEAPAEPAAPTAAPAEQLTLL